ncbi:MAG: hypothetical protein GY940_05095 [bacterium]|nr:hypothetical protein [bacterium]
MVASTHGRGMYAMDVRNLQQLTPEVQAKSAHLFDTLPAKLPVKTWWGYGYGKKAVVHYFLKAPQKVKLTVKDASGKTVNELKGTGDAGLNTVAWDMKFKPEKGKKPKYPFVKPGKYTVVLTAGSQSVEGTVEVKK